MPEKVVVITGASAGVGRATAAEFARRGWAVGLLARGEARLRDAADEVRALGGKAHVYSCDVADAAAIEKAASTFEENLGPIRVWINNAMASVFAPVVETTPEEYRRVTDVTYLGYVYGTLSALRRMRPRREGTIVQVGSALAYRSIPLQSAYCAAKHAVKGFTDSLRCELLHEQSRIRLTMVQLPALNTPQFGWVKSRLPRKAQPVPPIYQPEVAARAIYWAAHHSRRELNVGANVSLAVWGNKLAPGVADRYLARTGFDGQQYDGREDPRRPNNLFQSVDMAIGAHGGFDERAQPRSLHAWWNMHWRAIAAASAGVVYVAGRMYNRQETPLRAHSGNS